MSYRWRALAVGAFYFCFGAMERGTWPNLLPTIADDLDVEVGVVAWLIVAFALGMAGSTLTAGRLGDLLGHKRLAVGGLVAEAILLGLAAIIPVLWPMFIIRFAQGIAAAAALNNITAITIGSFGGKERGRVLGAVAGLAAVGLLMGPLYGGLIADWVSWRLAIAGLSALIMVQAFLTLLIIHPAERPDDAVRMPMRRLDWPGAVTLMLTMVALLVGAQFLRGADTRLLGGLLLLAAAGGLSLTIWLEHRSPGPILNLPLFKKWSFTSATIGLIWFSISFGAIMLLFPFYFQNGLGWTVAYSGTVLIALNVVQPWGSLVSGFIADRFGAGRVMAAGIVVAALGLFVASRLGANPAVWQVLVPLILFGTATSLYMPPNNKVIYSEVGRDALGSAAATATSGRYIGQSLGTAVAAAMLVAHGPGNVPAAFTSAMQVLGILLVSGMVALALARPLWALVKGRRSVPAPAGEAQSTAED